MLPVLLHCIKSSSQHFRIFFRVSLSSHIMRIRTWSNLFCTTSGIIGNVSECIAMTHGLIPSENAFKCGTIGGSTDRDNESSNEMSGGHGTADFRHSVQKHKRQLRHMMHMPCFKSSIGTHPNDPWCGLASKQRMAKLQTSTWHTE